MAYGLSFHSQYQPVNHQLPHVRAGLAAARSVIRRAGFTLHQAQQAAAAPGGNPAAAAAWWRALAIGRAIGWPGGRAPGGLQLRLCGWPNGQRGGQRGAGA